MLNIVQSSLNIFVKENHFYGTTEPNVPVIIGFIFGVVVIVFTALFLFTSAWHKKNCFPVQLAGKTAWIRKGGRMKDLYFYHINAGYDELSFFDLLKSDWNNKGYNVLGFYTDPGCTKPLKEDAIVNGSVQIFPKIVKKQ